MFLDGSMYVFAIAPHVYVHYHLYICIIIGKYTNLKIHCIKNQRLLSSGQKSLMDSYHGQLSLLHNYFLISI